MPHNRTRIWVGLAIAAVTIPAVGQYYYSSATHNLEGAPIAGQANLASRQRDSFGSGRISMRQSKRDYQAEVDAALARASTRLPEDGATRGTTPLFQVTSIETPYGEPGPSDVANADVSVDDSTGGTDPGDYVPTNTAQPAYDPYVGYLDDSLDEADAGLTDEAIYQLVVSNLQPDDRRTFVRSWALMTPDEQADMLDGFRSNLQSTP